MNPIRAGRCEERSAWRLPPQRAPGIYDGMRTALVIALTILLASCGDDSSSGTAIVDAGSRDAPGDVANDEAANEPDAPLPSFTAPGPFAAGQATVEVSTPDPERTLTVELWYPSSALTNSQPVTALVPRERRDAYQTLLDDAPAGCPSTATESARDGNTLFDALDGSALAVDVDTLRLRADDMVAVLDGLLSGDVILPDGLVLDADRVGAFGHSFGSVTTGLVTLEDERIRAAAGIAAPMENPLLPGVEAALIDVPLLLIVAREDNSITEFGNDMLRENFSATAASAWKVEVEDAGHWSFSNLCGLVDDFMPGCGEDRRQTDITETFAYLPIEQGIDIASAYLTAFFSRALRGTEGADDLLNEAPAEWPIELESR